MAVQAPTAPVKKRANRKLQEALSAYLFITPYLLSVLVFTLGALLYAFYVSFSDMELFNTTPVNILGLRFGLPQNFVGLDQYMNVFQDRDFHKALGNTFIFSAVVVFAQTWLALLMAVALNTKLRALRFFRVAWYAPSVTSSVVISLIFFWLYNTNGYINYFLFSLFGWAGFQPVDWLNNTTTALPAIMTMNIFTTAPTFMLMFLAALQDIPRDVYEAASIDGATGPRVFFNITLPLLRPIIFLVVVLGTIGTLQVFDQIYVMTNGGPLKSTMTVGFLIYRAAFRDSEMAFASAMAFILFVIIFLLFLVQRRVLERGGEA
jgi:multiple sugar transport system permease protein